MPQSIFFSWQADTPSENGRSFIKSVLEDVCKSISSDTSINEAVRDVSVDSDTQNVPGQPPIVDAIFKKIDSSAVFVADLTFVGMRADKTRPTPNPNVLIEYGWALRGLTHSRVICVMNIAYGIPDGDNLPFDLRHLRWPIRYNLPDNASPELKEEEEKRLFVALKAAIQNILRISLLNITEPKLIFPEVKAKNGPARFRSEEEPIGFDNEPFGAHREVFLDPGPAMWLRLMPTLDTKKRWASHELKAFAVTNEKINLSPILGGIGGYGYMWAEDGFGIYGPTNGPSRELKITTSGIAFAFETGEIWGIDTTLLDSNKQFIPFVEHYYIHSLQNYINLLKLLDLQPPFKWNAGIVGVKNRLFQIPAPPGGYNSPLMPTCLADLIEVEGIYDGEKSVKESLLPFFKKIFDKCGRPRPDYL